MAEAAPAPEGGRALVTGACGFIGTCLSLHLLDRGWQVTGWDNLSRPGARLHLDELRRRSGFTFHPVELADRGAVDALFHRAGAVDAIFHLAGQVAVTRSFQDRRLDFESNLVGSFNLLEAVARWAPGAYCLYASTNKVYGALDVDVPVGPGRPLDPVTPYGVSKAAAEMYFTEYGREPLGLTTCSLRQSCVYGHHQLGTEDQGWLAWFAVANLLGLPVRIYGDGEQVRDLLYVDDLVALYLACLERHVQGVFPVGGGPDHAISLRRALQEIAAVTGRPFAEVTYGEARPGDQRCFVADLSWTRERDLPWRPRSGIREGLARMVAWLETRRADLEEIHARGGRGGLPAVDEEIRRVL